ncbi:hypothetical protein ACIREO_23935 [Streptomyces sp. NPDC102441]|uniref:hypothetical protein n=1 Tax=Streptomyces sp. NPDC102441 TaxID=3366176 RepID=UPI00381DB3D7
MNDAGHLLEGRTGWRTGGHAPDPHGGAKPLGRGGRDDQRHRLGHEQGSAQFLDSAGGDPLAVAARHLTPQALADLRS